MDRGDTTYTAGTKKDNKDVQLSSAPRDSFWRGTQPKKSWGAKPRLQQDLFSHTVHRAVIILNKTHGVCEGWGSSFLRASRPGKRCLSPRQGSTGGKIHKIQLEWIQFWGSRHSPLLGDTDDTQREILFVKRLQTPLLCCLQSLVISEGHHKRGTSTQLNPKPREIHGERGGIPSQRKHSASCSVLGLLCFHSPGEFPVGCTGILHLAGCRELQSCHFPHPGVHSQQL